MTRGLIYLFIKEISYIANKEFIRYFLDKLFIKRRLNRCNFLFVEDYCECSSEPSAYIKY
jgi:hypothetical protein